MTAFQIANGITENPEGGTADVYGAELPKTGYFVGGAGSVLIFPSAGKVDRDLTEKFILSADSRFVGWWTDDETGKVYIDATEWFQSYDDAERVTRERGEIAFWDIASAREFRPVIQG